LGVCSHSVVAAQDNGEFVEWLKKASKFVTTIMPKGRGRKGGHMCHQEKGKNDIHEHT